MVEQSKASRTPYADRLAQAMSLLENPMLPVELAEKLGISRQAIAKLLKGESKEMSVSNHARAARLLNVDSHWLATGEGVAQPEEFNVRWHERRLVELFRMLPPDEQDEFATSLESRAAIHQAHEERPAAVPIARAISSTARKQVRTKDQP